MDWVFTWTGFLPALAVQGGPRIGTSHGTGFRSSKLPAAMISPKFHWAKGTSESNLETSDTSCEKACVGLSYASKIIAKLVLVAELLSVDCTLPGRLCIFFLRQCEAGLKLQIWRQTIQHVKKPATRAFIGIQDHRQTRLGC